MRWDAGCWKLEVGVLPPTSNFQPRRRSFLYAKGQSIMEYVVLIGVVAAAVLGMQAYAKRGIQAGIKVAADRIGSQQEGLEDINLSLPWKVSGETVISKQSDALRTTSLLSQGSVMTQTQATEQSRGALSKSAFSRDQ